MPSRATSTGCSSPWWRTSRRTATPIVERLSERSGGAFDLAEGTVYPALHRLEGAGC